LQAATARLSKLTAEARRAARMAAASELKEAEVRRVQEARAQAHRASERARVEEARRARAAVEHHHALHLSMQERVRGSRIAVLTARHADADARKAARAALEAALSRDALELHSANRRRRARIQREARRGVREARAALALERAAGAGATYAERAAREERARRERVLLAAAAEARQRTALQQLRAAQEREAAAVLRLLGRVAE
jgi:hypothetical protein